jgi:hypothetical protein
MITVEVPVLLPKSYTLVIYKEDSTVAPVADGQPPLCLDVTALPPILINIALPDTYPTHVPPQILSLHSTHSWLPPMAALEDRLLALWTPQDGVLYNWIEYLESARFLDDLGMLNSTSDTMRCVLRCSFLSLLSLVLTNSQTTASCTFPIAADTPQLQLHATSTRIRTDLVCLLRLSDFCEGRSMHSALLFPCVLPRVSRRLLETLRHRRRSWSRPMSRH